MTKKIITQSELKELYNYDPLTGIFTYNNPLPRCRFKHGDVAGSLSRGYVRMRVQGKNYRAHRLAWLYMFEVWPKHQIDHINHDRSDNRINNLREATHQENQRNRSVNKNNTSDVCGVNWEDCKWRSRITIDRKNISLGRFIDKFEAICARKSAENLYGFHSNHGI